MSNSDDKKGGISSVTAAVLGAIAVLCVALIGTTGYVKYQLDRSETLLAAPDVSFTPDDEVYERTMHALGYGGYLGAAQLYLTSHDKAALADMKQYIRTAQDTLSRMAGKTPAAVRHDIQAILDLYTDILTRAQAAAETPNPGFSTADLTAAYTALPTLDARLAAAVATGRMHAQDAFKFWGLALTLTAWLSLILAAATMAGLYLSVRNRQSAPLRALAQSVENLSRGDMQTAIWGMERGDAIGELARSVDMARYHFAQLPDLSLMSEQGPVRIKFEGETRSLFQAMMQNIGGDYEKARAEIAGMTRTITTQQDLLTALSVRLNTAVNQLQQHGSHSQQALQSLTDNLTGSTQALLSVQEKAAAHVEKLVPFMQERAHNMAEVTHIAGTKVTQTLQNLLQTEQKLRGSMALSQEKIDNLATSANGMNERLFAAVNLMQASGKALGETLETTQSRLSESIETLGRGENRLQQIAARSEERLAATAESEAVMASLATRTETSAIRMENAITLMSDRHEQLSEQVVLGTHRMESIIHSFDAAQKAMAEAMQTLRRDGTQLSGVLLELRANNDKLIDNLSSGSLANHEAVQSLTERGSSLLDALEAQITRQAGNAEGKIAALAASSDTLAQQAQAANSALTLSVAAMRQEQDKFIETRKKFGETLDALGDRLERQAAGSFGRTEKLAEQSFGKLAGVADNVESITQRLAMLSQLTGTLGAVAGQLGQIVPTLSQTNGGSGSDGQMWVKETQAQWQQNMSQVTAMRDELTRLLLEQKDQLETRLSGFEKKLAASGSADPQQTAIMNEIVLALGRINDHVLQLEEAMQESGARKA